MADNRNAEQAAIHDEIREWYERYPHEWGPLPEELGAAVQMLISDDVLLRHRLGEIGGLKLDLTRKQKEVEFWKAEIQKANKCIELLGGHPLTYD